jgi:queuine tRNA-ribosyltransferase
MRRRDIPTRHGPIPCPAFLPDATRGFVRGIDSSDLESSGVGAVMANAFHLGNAPGCRLIGRLGGLHGFLSWHGPVATDSGGFQIYSLISASGAGSVSNKGFVHREEGTGRKRLLGPAKAMTRQLRLGADVAFCLDHCTHPDEPASVQRQSVEHTIAWARRCKQVFDRWCEGRKPGDRPLLFAVVQGGKDLTLRRACAERLLEIGFDGYGFGGWPVAEDGGLVDMVAAVAEMIRADFPLHALGIGKPENVVRAHRAGYDSFDSALVTRDARRGRIYVATGGMSPEAVGKPGAFDRLYVEDARHARDPRPLDEGCDCLACRRYSRAYLHHLFATRDGAAMRLLTLHNLRFMARLMTALGASREEAG